MDNIKFISLNPKTNYMNTMNINIEGLLNILNQQEKVTFVNIVTETKVRMNKTNNIYYDKVMKRSKCNYLLGMDYERRVRINEGKEGLTPDFTTEECKVGEHISKCVLFNEGKGKYYLMVERFDEIKPQVEYTFEGNSIDKVLFQDFMVKYSESKKQDQERKVKVITFSLENIKELTLNGTRYIVE